MDEKKETATVYQWIPSKEGVQEFYGNVILASWTLFDVRFRVGQLIPDPKRPEPNTGGFVAEERAAITIAWPHAKVLRDNLIDLVARYEKANGEIKPLILPTST
jgi:hypothetical protein